MLLGDIVEIVQSRPLRMDDEKKLQAEIAEMLDAAGIDYKREVDLGGGDVIDFMFRKGIGMEVKLRESKRAIYRQCRRYCLHKQVSTLVLLTGTALGFPEEVEGKPCYVVSIGGGWL